MSDGVDTNVVINYASVNTNRVNIPVTTSRVEVSITFHLNQSSFLKY